MNQKNPDDNLSSTSQPRHTPAKLDSLRRPLPANMDIQEGQERMQGEPNGPREPYQRTREKT